MKRLILVTAFAAGIFGVILAQPKKETKSNSPKEDIKVNKKFDEQGNLIQYDSTYTFRWSSDTTLTNQMSPEDFQKFFGGNFGFFKDSTMLGHSFFDDFDQMFSDHFGMMSDSTMIKNFDARHFLDFDYLFGFSLPEKQDSSSLKNHNKIAGKSQRQSIDDVMQMFKEQVQEMEEHHRFFFQNQSK